MAKEQKIESGKGKPHCVVTTTLCEESAHPVTFQIIKCPAKSISSCAFFSFHLLPLLPLSMSCPLLKHRVPTILAAPFLNMPKMQRNILSPTPRWYFFPVCTTWRRGSQCRQLQYDQGSLCEHQYCNVQWVWVWRILL